MYDNTTRRSDITDAMESLARRLDSWGWSTTIPDSSETHQPTAWPPTGAKGKVTAQGLKTHARLHAEGRLGKLVQDEEGMLCCKILR